MGIFDVYPWNEHVLSLWLGCDLHPGIDEQHLLAQLTRAGLKWEAAPWEMTTLSLCIAVPMLLGGSLAAFQSLKEPAAPDV